MRNVPIKKLMRSSSLLLVLMLTAAISTTTKAETYYFHNDQLGTPQVVTDNQRQVVWQGEYGPFGSVNETVALVVQNIRFPGQYFDQETSLNYNYFRTYDPVTSRYLENDPIGLNGGLNLSGYANSNPIVNVDPFGLAYFAKRPLNGWPWFGKFSCDEGSLDDKFNTEISHEQLFFEDGNSPGNLGFFSDSSVKPDDPAQLSRYRCSSRSYDDCIMREAVKNVPGGAYCLLGKPGVAKNNCQDWADRVRLEYERLSLTALKDSCSKCKF